MLNRKLLLGFICVLAISCKNKNEESVAKNDKNKPVSVDVIIASAQHLSNTVEANGTIVASESAEIHPEVSGRITYLNTPDGAHVKAGTVLAKINDAELQAQLVKSKEQLSIASKTAARLQQLLSINGINQADYDVAATNVNNINADIQLLHAQLDKAVIRAPFSGVLGLRLVSAGSYVTPQTNIVTLQNIDRVKVDFTLPETYSSFIKKGMNVRVISNDNTTKSTATIIATDGEINGTTRNMKVRAILNGSSMTPGTFVKILLETGNEQNKIIIPTNAIIPDATSKKVVVVKGGKGVMVKVETGVRTAGGVEVTSGLSIGDSVAVTGVLFVKPNADVIVKHVKKIEDLMKVQ